MRLRFSIRSCNVFLSLVVGLILAESSVNAADIYVRLRDTAVVNTNQVLLRSVATVLCSDPVQKNEVEETELKLLDLSLPQESISARYVKIRLALAGFPMDDIHILGSGETIVVFQASQKLTDLQVEDEALKVMCQVLNSEPDDLKVVLQSSVVQSLPKEVQDAGGLKLKVLPPTRRGLGSVSLTVQIWQNERMILARSAMFDVRRRHRVAVARVSLSREVPMNESNVQFENRFMTTEVDELDPTQVIGRTVRGTVVAGSIVQMRDLQMDTRSNAEMKIRKGDTVQVIAVASRLRTVIRNAEALEDGRLGARIRLMNRDSEKEFVGEVLGPGQAIVHVK